MNYSLFIETIQQQQAAKVTAKAFERCCAMDIIPQVFNAVVANIVRILDGNHQHFCQANEKMAVIGMQVGPMMLESQFPLAANRIYSEEKPRTHYCLSLTYVVKPINEIDTITSWEDSQNIMIDFTTGEVMGADRYFTLLAGGDGYVSLLPATKESPKGILYGTLSPRLLTAVWQQVKQIQPFDENTLCESNPQKPFSVDFIN